MILVNKIKPTNENPNLAPAVVDDNKWEPPIAAPAKIIPGPKLLYDRVFKKLILFLCSLNIFPLYFDRASNKKYLTLIFDIKYF